MPIVDPRGGGNVHIDQILTNISVAYPNEGMVGEQLFPTVRVRKQSDKYYVFGREAWAVEPGGDFRAPAAVANEIPGIQLSTDTYFAQEHSLQIAVADEELENSDNVVQPYADATELVTAKVLLGREIAMQSMVTTAANYATGNTVTLSGTSQFNDYVNSDPIGVFRTAKRAFHAKMFIEPNVAVIPYQVMSQLEDHPDFIERIKYSERGILTEQIIASILGIGRVIVPGAGINTANPGQTASISYLWGKDILLAYVPARAGLRIPAFAYEFNWALGGNATDTLRWREEQRVAYVIRNRRRYDLKMVAQDATGKSIGGYLIKNAVA